ncbi:kinase-like domain-containing protein [Pterulicium gracile]|uniref:non-specific serine/threonine protein kinase n=1 Tax=Pterulicium gracile TaxID=1884261 RepID=A0A5C3QPK8_9AGAR|nr:kinase-like domain-containing protein [Pterula gracilis]
MSPPAYDPATVSPLHAAGYCSVENDEEYPWNYGAYYEDVETATTASDEDDLSDCDPYGHTRIIEPFKLYRRGSSSNSFSAPSDGNASASSSFQHSLLYEKELDPFAVYAEPEVQPSSPVEDTTNTTPKRLKAPVFTLPSRSPSPVLTRLTVFKPKPTVSHSSNPKPTPPPTFRIPGPFIVDRLIQDSAHWRVVACHYTDSQYTSGTRTPVCIKTFKKRVIANKRMESTVASEIRAYKQLSNAEDAVGKGFVVNLHGALQDEKRVYYVMDLMCGDLLHVLKHSPEQIPENAAMWIAQTARGLKAIHSAGVIHRDLKPENLLLDNRNNIKIIDFGCSYVHPYGEPILPTKTYSSCKVGTMPYMAPEMWDNGEHEMECLPYNGAVDWWALGCIAWELEAYPSAPLFVNKQNQNWYRRVCSLHEGLQPEHLEPGELSDEAASLIVGLLRQDPSTRFGYPELKKHRYFRDSNTNSSLFSHISHRASSRAVCRGTSAVGHRITKQIVYAPTDIPHDSTDTFATTTFAWINPSGAWGKDRHLGGDV